MNLRFALSLVISAGVCSGAVEDEAIRITVHVDGQRALVSPLLYGIFVEEINRAVDGGLYGELLENGSFEDDPSRPVAWTGLGRETIGIDTTMPLNERNKRSARISLGPNGGGIASLGFPGPGSAKENEPYPQGLSGIAIRKGQRYAASLYARCDATFHGRLAIQLESREGAVMAAHEIGELGPAWKRFEAILEPDGSDLFSRFVVEAKGPGTVWLDMVSLSQVNPDGSKLRPDLNAMVRAMHPRFVRFPGGSFVNGGGMKDAVKWKDTVGPLEERKGNWSIWGYHATGRFGLLEFLQWCEDLGAEPLYVINCGMAVAKDSTVPIDGMGPYVDDALDLIEYATGPADSKWGSLRAKDGRSKPFALNYLQIGNENGGEEYDKRYRLFHDAIKARYPKVRLIACDWAGSPPTSRTPDVIDQHFYGSPQDFLKKSHQYDKADRHGPGIYVGEYAATSGVGLGNALAAISEAVFMTGLERNSDVVVMSSYAPLLVNPLMRRWNPNAIVFDQGRTYGTPSYHVQCMFAGNVEECICPAEIAVPKSLLAFPAGAMCLSTWKTQAEFRDIRVEAGDAVLFDSAKEAGLQPWRSGSGNWVEHGGIIAQTGNDQRATLVTGDPSWGSNYSISLKARKIAGEEGFMIGFQMNGDRDVHCVNLGGWGNTKHSFEGIGQAKAVAGRIEAGRWYDVRVECRDGLVICLLDGREILRAQQDASELIYASATGSRDRTSTIVKVVNPGAVPRRVAIAIEGVKRSEDHAGCLQLSAGALSDENTFERPANVVPHDTQIPCAASGASLTIPPFSVSVLRFRSSP